MVHPPARRQGLQEAFAYCERLAKGRSENFTVVSWFFPRHLRSAMYAVYAFSRYTDDLGDEAAGDRLELLEQWEGALKGSGVNDSEAGSAILTALHETMRRHAIPIDPFLKLIEANRMDQRVSRYETYGDLLRYCEHSANSVGRMVLHLFGYADPRRQELADATCTALQLANLWQDVRRDYAQGRIYLPQEDMRRFGYTEDMLSRGESNQAFRGLMAFEVRRTRGLFKQGAPLAELVDGSLKLDVRLFTRGGAAVLDAIERASYDVLTRKPQITRAPKARLVMAGIAGLAAQRASSALRSGGRGSRG